MKLFGDEWKHSWLHKNTGDRKEDNARRKAMAAQALERKKRKAKPWWYGIF